MSTFLYEWLRIATESPLPSPSKHIITLMFTYMQNKKNKCFPSVIILMKRTGLSRQSIITHLRKIREAGFIKVEVGHFTGQRWRRHTYFPILPSKSEEN